MGDLGQNKQQGERQEQQIVVFDLAGEAYGVDINAVLEIIRMEEITAVPETADVCLAGVCQGASESPLLSVDAVSPQAVGSGRQTLTIRGRGFEPGATLSFHKGQGRAPRVRSLRFLDGQTLEADVEVSRKGPKRSRFWDVVVILSDGTQGRLRDGLRVDP